LKRLLQSWRTTPNAVTVVIVIGVLVIAVAVAALSLIRAPRPQTEDQIAYRPIERLEDGYVSSRSCRPCHPSQFDSWTASFHRTMTQVASPETVKADFHGVIDVRGRGCNSIVAGTSSGRSSTIQTSTRRLPPRHESSGRSS
jgi:hypothetical protein